MSQSNAQTTYPPDRTPEEAICLFKAIEEKFPSAGLGDERWYLVATAALSGSGLPEVAVQLYTYLLSKPEYSTPESRQKLIRRIREALVKILPLVGVPRTVEVIFGISKIEREEDKDYSFSRENWQPGPANRARSQAWLDRIYKGNLDSVYQAAGAHRDFIWITSEVVYGLFFSDHSILNDIETELVVVSALIVQNVPGEVHWHLRGLRRLGPSMEDVESVHQCIDLVAEFARVRVDKVPRVADIEHDV